ncbi:EF-hand domain [Macleaya cordata]|uniref:EF-hand domain n=1 Tax=Macleaya cordata TaxID=56857 RepID=A0A200QES5_MACCD|nr:EF-hand domain [Macleaya cordata]
MLSYVFSLMETFRAFDADNDGLISATELSGIMSSLGYNMSEQDVTAMTQQGDTNGDGLLSIEEFLERNTKEMELGELVTFLRTATEALDVDGEESVTGVDLYEVLGNIGIGLSLEDCKDIIASMDGNGDGIASFEDFKLIVNSLL